MTKAENLNFEMTMIYHLGLITMSFKVKLLGLNTKIICLGGVVISDKQSPFLHVGF